MVEADDVGFNDEGVFSVENGGRVIDDARSRWCCLNAQNVVCSADGK